MRLLTVLAALLCAAGLAGASPETVEVRTVRLQWTPGAAGGGTGRISVSPGKVIRVQGWSLQTGDTLGAGWSWQYGRSDSPRTLLVTIAAPHSAVLEVSDGERKHSFALAELEKSAANPKREGGLAAEVLPSPRLLSQAGESDSPALAASSDAGVWAAWISYDGRDDRIGLAQQNQGRWEARGFLPRVRGRLENLTLAAAGGHLVAVWVQERDGNWDLYGAVGSDGRWGKPTRITRGDGPDVGPQLAAGPGGRVWLVWQAFEGSFSHIRLASWEGGRWAPSILVTDVPANHWAPSVGVGPKGDVHVAWDSHEAGSYDIYTRALKDGGLSPIRRITDGPEYEANASVACEPGGRVWIAYDEGEANWGRDRHAAELHRERRVGIRCLEGDRLLQPPLPPTEALPGVAPFAEAPRLYADGRGQVWLAYRRTLRDGIWDLVTQRFDGRQWSRPVLLPDSAGRSNMGAAFAPAESGTPWLAWAADGSDTPLLRHAVCAALLPAGFPAGDRLDLPEAPLPRVSLDSPRAPRKRPVGTFSRDAYTLYEGDLQRYTELSACHPFQHGSTLDGVRFALDVAELDFVGFTAPPVGPSPGERFRWHQEQKLADLFTIDGTLVTLRGLECPAPGNGRGALFCTEADGASTTEALWSALLGAERPAGALAAWYGWSSDAAPGERMKKVDLVAPFEDACRGPYLSLDAPGPDRDSRGWWLSADARSALIAGTGHHSPDARTHLWAGYLTRDGLIRGLRERRSYIGPAGVTIHFSAQGKSVGSVVLSAGTPVLLAARVSAATPIRRVQLLLDGAPIQTVEVEGAKEAEVASTHSGTTGADHAYAIRVTCEDGSECWTTPIWVSDPKL